MIPDKISDLFLFIDYLYSNGKLFKRFEVVINEVKELKRKRSELKPQDNFADKLKCDEIQTEINDKFYVIQENIISIIKNKAIELEVCNFRNEPIFDFSGIEKGIIHLKKNFGKEDVSEILNYKSKYVEFRKGKNYPYFLEVFFYDLDSTLMELFGFFDSSYSSEIEQINKLKYDAEPSNKKIRIREMQYIVDPQRGQIVYGFLNALDQQNDKDLAIIGRQLENFIELRKSDFKYYPVVFDDLKNILEHNYFIELNNQGKSMGLKNLINAVLPPQQNEKPKPELNKALILFSSPEIINNLHNELKGYFRGSEAELLKALKGEQLTNLLLFPHNQNKFVEVFKRLKYNRFLVSTPKEINNWICSNFTYIKTEGDKKNVTNFNKSTIKTLLTNSVKERQVEPTPKERVCTPDWLPHYWSNELKNKQN